MTAVAITRHWPPDKAQSPADDGPASGTAEPVVGRQAVGQHGPSAGAAPRG
ncbi:hypothetical protein [Streptomyces zagrosensis]|uniref:Uncharacterized protein n=1 Tax=Streptomyces zagrosensis TaxID=1042984 RepID=A0A7W9QCL9_9ACTN|nr:hypothetical protein [Streptomyces zagrosensis]MBB5937641.1 hypothetical protein [Streptomyces zagrosensis]